jgi:hypothetical protein
VPAISWLFLAGQACYQIPATEEVDLGCLVEFPGQEVAEFGRRPFSRVPAVAGWTLPLLPSCSTTAVFAASYQFAFRSGEYEMSPASSVEVPQESRRIVQVLDHVHT